MSYNISDNSPRQERCNRPTRDISFNHETGAITEHGIAPDGCHCHGDAEELKRKYQALIEAAIKAREAAEAEKNNYVKKSGVLDILARDTTVVQKAAALLEAIANIHVDVPDNIATQEDVTAAKQAILEAIAQIDFSALAKQGSNSNISLTTMDEKLGNVVMMTDAEYQPALEDLATKLD